MSNGTSAQRQWEAFLNPEAVRGTLISAGLFLVAYEVLRSSIIDHPLEFFATTWTAKGPKPSEKYNREVRALDPKGKNDPLRGSLAWLRKEGVLSSDDLNAFEQITNARNNAAHELLSQLTGRKPQDYLSLYPTLVLLIEKVERWWIINVEVPTDPAWATQNINEDDVTPGPVLMMQILADVAAGDSDDAWQWLKAFKAQQGSPS